MSNFFAIFATNTLLFRNSSYSDKTDTRIQNTRIQYTRLFKRFDDFFFWNKAILFFFHLYL